jgi:lipopolysaccharide export system protein LptA
VRGNYISYDSRTEFFTVTGGASAGDTPAGRVHAVIQPRTGAEDGNAPPASPPKK